MFRIANPERRTRRIVWPFIIGPGAALRAVDRVARPMALRIPANDLDGYWW
jgi:hypothetical protein